MLIRGVSRVLLLFRVVSINVLLHRLVSFFCFLYRILSFIIVSFIIIGVSYISSFAALIFSFSCVYKLSFLYSGGLSLFFCSRASRSSLSSSIYVIHFVFGQSFLVECKCSFSVIVTMLVSSFQVGCISFLSPLLN